MELLQLLKDAREILTPAGAWTTKTLAREKSGAPVVTRSRYAVSFCMIGGLCRALDNANEFSSLTLRETAKALLLEAIPVRSRPDFLFDWNDHKDRTQAQVLACYDRAIAKVEKEEAQRG